MLMPGNFDFQGMSANLKNELSGLLVDHNISSFSMTPVKVSNATVFFYLYH